jgi:hypothetical protein
MADLPLDSATCEPDAEAGETIEILGREFAEWKRTHPNGTWQAFWAAVAAGDVKIPGV